MNSGFYKTVAKQILSCHAQDLPDLRGATVLLPNYHVAQPLAQALSSAASQPALLLPQMVTLNDWARSVPLATPVVPDTCRATTLYQALRMRKWFADADLWGIARELLALLDELTRHHVTLPQDEEEFLAQLERAYQAKRNAAMQFEARVVHELWYAMSASGELDAARAYQQRLAQLAQQADAPLYVLVTAGLDAPEACFLEAYAERAPVVVFDLREMVAEDESCAVLRTLSPNPSPASARGEQTNSLSPQWERAGEITSDLAAVFGQPSRMAITNDLAVVVGQPSQMASSFTSSSIRGGLRDQAAHLREHFPQAALNNPSTKSSVLSVVEGSGRTGRELRLFGAHSLEQEARAAEVQVRRWLLAGKRSIALVAQDRLVARRVRALLERSGVLMRDESGWTMSTLAVSTVLMRWLDALQSDFYYQDLLDLLKSPFIFSDQDSSVRKQAVYRLEQLVRKHGVASRLDAFLDLAHGENEMQTALARLRQASRMTDGITSDLAGVVCQPSRMASSSIRGQKTENGAKKSLVEWLEVLHNSLDILGVLQGWAQDDAGQQMLQLLGQWAEELRDDATRFSFAEWRHWLAQQLDAHTFRDTSIDSPVLLTHLAATRWRSFDAVLLLGADASHLPGTDNGSVWFNDAVRSTLGLPTREHQLAQQRDDLLALLAMNDTVLATWQASKSGEKNLLSPYLEMLRALHELAYGDDLAVSEDRGQGTEDRVSCGFATPSFINCRAAATKPLSSVPCPLSSDRPLSSAMPAPAVPQSLIPGRISASGYNSLVACPYQFYARHILGLNELDEVREGVDKRDYGEWVHDILHRFHQQLPALIKHDRAALEEALLHISNEVFAPAVERDYLARAWLLRWQQAIPAYLDAQLKSETEGWGYQNGEVPFELPLTDELTLHGRIDRVDARESECRVLDYKMMEATRLRNKLKEAGEDVQLACYAHVYEADEAAFISIEKDKVVSVAPPQDLPELAQANIERLKTLFAQVRGGAAMPAHGVDEACAYCEMRGLCRKGEWASSAPPFPTLPPEGEGLDLPLDETTSHSTRLPKTAAKSPVIPSGEGPGEGVSHG
ncbi:MAG: PD-(D/E)XK nuclease family protein [Nitrosomonadales bacterium]|nr:PD-(D/E)XK nuclease family protein [Nitrosomonadales bacterium]